MFSASLPILTINNHVNYTRFSNTLITCCSHASNRRPRRTFMKITSQLRRGVLKRNNVTTVALRKQLSNCSSNTPSQCQKQLHAPFLSGHLNSDQVAASPPFGGNRRISGGGFQFRSNSTAERAEVHPVDKVLLCFVGLSLDCLLFEIWCFGKITGVEIFCLEVVVIVL